MNKEQFILWATERDIKLVPTVRIFSTGDTVTFTNDYGVKFENLQIIGISEDDSFYGRCIYLNKDSYWFPEKPTQLNKTN